MVFVERFAFSRGMKVGGVVVAFATASAVGAFFGITCHDSSEAMYCFLCLEHMRIVTSEENRIESNRRRERH